MEEPCPQLNTVTLIAWVDGEASSEQERQHIADHVSACALCAERTAAQRAYRARIVGYQAGTQPAELPAGFLQQVSVALDREDARRRPLLPAPQSARRLRLALALATIVVLLCGALALPRLRPHRTLSLAALLALPGQGPTFPTEDADLAAQWLRIQLHADVPAVNLDLNGARLQEARAYPDANMGTLHYVTAQGQPIRLIIAPDARPQTDGMLSMMWEGSAYHVKEDRSRGESCVVWQADGIAYVADAPLPLTTLLPLAREMDRHCQQHR